MRTLRLSLDSDLYNKVARGERKEVYAKLKIAERDRESSVHAGDRWKVKYTPRISDYDKVVFSRGTSNITMKYQIDGIEIYVDNPNWVLIKLGEKV